MANYPKVPANVQLPNLRAPEATLPERTGELFAGTSDPVGSGPHGVQPGFDLPGVSPMVPGFGEVFGPQP